MHALGRYVVTRTPSLVLDKFLHQGPWPGQLYLYFERPGYFDRHPPNSGVCVELLKPDWILLVQRCYISLYSKYAFDYYI